MTGPGRSGSMDGFAHIGDANVRPMVGLAVRIGSTTSGWAKFEGRDGVVSGVYADYTAVWVPGLGEYRTSGYNLWVKEGATP